MAARATPSPADRLAFANQLAEVRAMDVEGGYTEELNELEVEYQFILLRSLDLFHKEMLRAQLPDKLHAIKEKLCDTAGPPAYQTNLPFTSWNWDIKICRQCKKNRLKPRPFAHDLYCENCGLLKPLDAVAFDYNELYSCGDYKIVKQRRGTRRYNFRDYLDKHAKCCKNQGFTLSRETIRRANEFFEGVEEQLPKRISMPFVAYKIFKKIALKEEQFILPYFWVQVPQGSVAKHEEKWDQLQQPL